MASRGLPVLALLAAAVPLLAAPGCYRSPYQRPRLVHPEEEAYRVPVQFRDVQGLLPDLPVVFEGTKVGKILEVRAHPDGSRRVVLSLMPGVALPPSTDFLLRRDQRLGLYLLITRRL